MACDTPSPAADGHYAENGHPVSAVTAAGAHWPHFPNIFAGSGFNSGPGMWVMCYRCDPATGPRVTSAGTLDTVLSLSPYPRKLV